LNVIAAVGPPMLSWVEIESAPPVSVVPPV
jgi:hypothetical protein